MMTIQRNSIWGGALSMLCQALIIALSVWTTGADAQTTSDRSTPNTQSEQSPKVQLLLNLFEDQEIQEWVKEQKQASIDPTETKPDFNLNQFFADRIKAVSQHLSDLSRALPTVPGEFVKLTETTQLKTQGYGFISILAITLIFILSGFLAAWIFRKATSQVRSDLNKSAIAGPSEKFRLMMRELLLAAGSVVAFGIGSVASLLVSNLSDPLENLILQLVIAAWLSWATWSILNFLLKPSSYSTNSSLEVRRVIPIGDRSARHFSTTLTLAATWFYFGYTSIYLFQQQGMDVKATQLIAYVLGLGLLFIGLYIVAKQPSDQAIKIATKDALVHRRPAKKLALFNWLHCPLVALDPYGHASFLVIGSMFVSSPLPSDQPDLLLTVFFLQAVEEEREDIDNPSSISSVVGGCCRAWNSSRLDLCFNARNCVGLGIRARRSHRQDRFRKQNYVKLAQHPFHFFDCRFALADRQDCHRYNARQHPRFGRTRKERNCQADKIANHSTNYPECRHGPSFGRRNYDGAVGAWG